MSKRTPALYAYREYITDKRSYSIDTDGSRLGETPNIAMDAGTPELASFIVQAYSAHDELVEALVNSNIELVSLLNKISSVTDRTMIHLRMDANSRIINQARGE